MHIDPQYISLATKTLNSIHRDSYVSTIDIDILYGDEREKIGEAKAFEVRMDQIVNEGESMSLTATQATWLISTQNCLRMTNCGNCRG